MKESGELWRQVLVFDVVLWASVLLSMISVGFLGNRPIVDLLRLGDNFFFCSKRSPKIHSSTTESGTVKSGLKLLAVESIEPLGGRAEFFHKPGTDMRCLQNQVDWCAVSNEVGAQALSV